MLAHKGSRKDLGGANCQDIAQAQVLDVAAQHVHLEYFHSVHFRRFVVASSRTRLLKSFHVAFQKSMPFAASDKFDTIS